MGFRAHQRIVSKIKYDNADDFNCNFEKIREIIEANSLITDEWTWEIDPEDLKKCIEGIKEKYRLEDIAFEHYTYGDIVKVFERWLEKAELHKDDLDNNSIYIDWF